MRTSIALPVPNYTEVKFFSTKLKPAPYTEVSLADLLGGHHLTSHDICCQMLLSARATRSAYLQGLSPLTSP